MTVRLALSDKREIFKQIGTVKADGRCSVHHASKARHFLAVSLNTLATIQVVLFYLSRVPSAMNLVSFEAGTERTPMQQRMLMMLLLRWSHRSHVMHLLAASMTFTSGWFPAKISPEGLLQTSVDVASVAVTGMVARRIYLASSPRKLLTPFIYPIVLAMVTATYSLMTMHSLRFVYDLPALAFFSIGLFIIYFELHPLLFVMLFVAATVNRETSLLLLPLYALAQCRTKITSTHHLPALNLRLLTKKRALLVILPLGLFWIEWHRWVTAHYSLNVSASGPRLFMNITTVAFPLTWPQLASCCCYLWPFVIVHRKLLADPLLRAWILLPVMSFCFMLYFGLILETRVFGEIIPYMACATALIAEELLLTKMAVTIGLRHATPA